MVNSFHFHKELAMTSLRKLAATVRNQPPKYHDYDRDIFVTAVLEIAHAIKRGRKPNSCSVLPGQNIRQWLHKVFTEEHSFCRDMFGDNCSIALAKEEQIMRTTELMYFWEPPTSDELAILQAIRTCGTYLLPLRKPEDIRGDYLYQDRHKVTNRKKKTIWLRRRQGYHYDDGDYHHLDDHTGFCNSGLLVTQPPEVQVFLP
jgi:hypothetical protein